MARFKAESDAELSLSMTKFLHHLSSPLEKEKGHHSRCQDLTAKSNPGLAASALPPLRDISTMRPSFSTASSESHPGPARRPLPCLISQKNWTKYEGGRDRKAGFWMSL